MHSNPPPASSALDTALWALDVGLWPVPIHPYDAKGASPGKRPIGQSWGKDRPDETFLRSTFKRQPKANVGLKLGADGGVIDIDVDQPEHAVSTLARLFPDGNPATLGWSNADGKFHFVFRYDERCSRYGKTIIKGVVKPDGEVTGNPRYAGLEIRIGAAPGDGKQLQTVIPPSLMSNGQARRWNGHETILPLPESFFLDLDRYAVEKPALSLVMEDEDIERKSGQAAAPKADTVGAAGKSRRNALKRASAYLAKCPPSVDGQRGHDALLKAAMVGPGFDLTPDELYRLLLTEFNPRCEPPWEEPALRHKVSEAFKVESRRGWLLEVDRKGVANGSGRSHRNGSGSNGTGQGGLSGDGPSSKPPEIEVNTERHRVLAETVKALPADADLYSRGAVLVLVHRVSEDIARLPGGVELRNAAGSVQVAAVGRAEFSCRLSKLAEFYSWFPGGKGEPTAKPAHPPPWLVDAIFDREVHRGVRPLRGVAEVPFPRPDGSLVTTPGYDVPTGIYYWPSITLRPLPERPTQADAEAAARLLLKPVEQFPFVSDDDKAVWLASLLNVIARPAIDGPVPGTAFNGNMAGTGKGKLIDSLTMIATGRPLPTTSYPKDQDEIRKLKVALALAVTQCVHLDNLDEGQGYGGGVLDSALTSMEINDRILCTSRPTGRLELRCVWFLSGNNISPMKDAFRRWLVCNLATDLERPEERDDLKIPDLLAHIRKHRAELVRAALIILRAHAVAGRPTGGWAPLGSFEQWDPVVRGAVWFATGRDCNTTRKKVAEDAPERQARLALLEAWRDLQNGGPDGYGVTSEKAALLARDEAATHPELADALARLSKDGKVSSATSIGRMIRAMMGKNIGGLAFQKRGEHRRSVLWHVVTANQAPPVCRNKGKGPRQKCECCECCEASSNPPRRGLDSDYDVMAHGSNGAAKLEGSRPASQHSQYSHQDDREDIFV